MTGNTTPPAAGEITERGRKRLGRAQESISGSGLLPSHEDDLRGFLGPLSEVRWGSAVVLNDSAERQARMFFDRIHPDPTFLAKGVLAADHAEGMSRWDALAVVLRLRMLEHPSLQLFEDGLRITANATSELIMDGLMEGHGDPPQIKWSPGESGVVVSRQRRFARPAVVLLQERLAAQIGYLDALLSQSSVRFLLASPDEYRQVFQPLVSIYMQGYLIDYEQWIFTNAESEDLGPLPSLDPRPRV